MAYAKRTDSNQTELVKLARKMGASVWITSSLGNGAPDFVLGVRGINLLVECKDGEKSPSQRKLTPCEQLFHLSWNGQIAIISSTDELVQLINGIGTHS